MATGQSNTSKVNKAVRLPPGVAERVEKYAEERDMSEADALRQLVSDGLRYEAEFRELAESVENQREELESVGRKLRVLEREVRNLDGGGLLG